MIGSLCLLVLVSVSILFSLYVCLDDIYLSGHLLGERRSFGLPRDIFVFFLTYCNFSYFPLWSAGL